MGRREMHYFVALSAFVAIASAEPVNAQQVKAGVLTCDVSEGMGYIIGSQKLLSCRFSPEGPGRREDYDGSITKFGLDLGLTRSGVMVWAVFSNTVAGPGFLAGDYFGASGEATVGAGVGAKPQWEFPRLCRGGSKSLTYPAVDTAAPSTKLRIASRQAHEEGCAAGKIRQFTRHDVQRSG